MPDKQFWDSQYIQGETGWDMGMESPPLKDYIDQLSHKELRILIPGSGNSYEAFYLMKKGFTHITILDIAPTVVERLKEKIKDLSPGRIQVIEKDFFQHEGKYDLILEQTFFCALDPSLRKDYAEHMHALLANKGKLAGVLFNRTFEPGHPPFGGHASAYKTLFAPYFHFRTWEPCYHSFPSRAGSEWFMILEKK
jgi:hypothetical protein